MTESINEKIYNLCQDKVSVMMNKYGKVLCRKGNETTLKKAIIQWSLGLTILINSQLKYFLLIVSFLFCVIK